MNKVFLFIFSTLIIFSCKKEIIGDPVVLRNCDILQTDASLTKADAQKYIYNTWILKQMITMLPSQNVPNIRILFKVTNEPLAQEIVDVFIDDLLVGSVKYSFKESVFQNNIYVTLESSENYIGNSNEYNFINGGLRICENQLMIDNGMAFDAPAYIFEKE